MTDDQRLSEGNMQMAESKITWDNTSPTMMKPGIALSPAEKIQRDGLTKISIAGYAVSHFGNDLCAACWFTYVLYYVLEVVGLS